MSTAVQRGRPDFAGTQEDELLGLLKEAKARGVSREWLIFTRRMSQCGRAINTLEKRGCVIRHESRPGSKFVWYVLESEPLELRPLPEGTDWYEATTGKARPAEPAPGPLFSQAEADRR